MCFISPLFVLNLPLYPTVKRGQAPFIYFQLFSFSYKFGLFVIFISYYYWFFFFFILLVWLKCWSYFLSFRLGSSSLVGWLVLTVMAHGEALDSSFHFLAFTYMSFVLILPTCQLIQNNFSYTFLVLSFSLPSRSLLLIQLGPSPNSCYLLFSPNIIP